MYSATTDRQTPPPNAGKYIKLIVIAVIAIATLVVVGNEGVILYMNFSEFNEQFTRPLYYTLVSSVILSSIALVRVNILGRSSIFWYALKTGVALVARGPRPAPNQEPISDSLESYSDYKLSPPQFVVWQITKVLLFGAFFANVMFGFGAVAFLVDGNMLGVEHLPTLFTLPFVTPPEDTAYAAEQVIPMIPALVVLISPMLAAIGLRLVLYVGVHRLIYVITSFVQDSNSGKPRYLNYVSTLEGLAGIAVLWIGFNMFFTNQIDYNTRYEIGGVLIIGFALLAFSAVDKIRARVLTHMFKRDVWIRLLTIAAIGIALFVFVNVNDTIADARKIEYLGPYTAQQIGVNRYLGQLDNIQENTHDVQLTPISPNNINNYVHSNADVLDVIRVWDWEAAFAKLKPEIGLIPYVDFEDNDILRFNDTLYWTASMKPILPSSVSVDNQWYNEHLVYTHVPDGFLTLEATDGQIVDSDQFFQQREIYYGEGGLFELTWSGYPTSRGAESAELGGAFYSGLGGLAMGPPFSWIFEPNFLLQFPTEPVHVMRYKDVNHRMEVLYPYFLYDLFGKELDSLPVTDGTNSYWLIPLIIGFDTQNVPWSIGNPYLRLVGYALVDSYDGDIQLLKTGDDFFTEMFAAQYADQFSPMPAWLEEQIRYPVELFNWKTEMYNIYHVTDVETFIQANEFYEIPGGLDTYYVEAKPPGFNQTEFLGLLSLELRGSQGRNLAGYIVVENTLSNLGDIQFYKVPLNSTTKLIGPTAVREALDRDPEFAQLKTLLRTPRIGDNILYRVGEHDVYFIPVYTAGAGGVVAQLGTIAAVGAAFNGEYFVGLGDTQEAAFEAYLSKVSGVAPAVSAGGDGEAENFVMLERDDRVDIILQVFEDAELEIVRPASLSVPLSFNVQELFFYTDRDRQETEEALAQFVDDYIVPRTDRVLVWEEEPENAGSGSGITVNIGTVLIKDGIPELHYVSVGVGI